MTATAELIALPGTRLVGVQRLPYAERARLLEVLSRQEQWLEPAFVTILVAALAHDSLSKADLEHAWQAVTEAVGLLAAAEIDILDWDWRCGSCGHPFARGCDCTCCPSAKEHARDVADEALSVLAGGAR